MVALGTLFLLLTLVSLFLRKQLMDSRWYLWVMLFAIPRPYIAIEIGWPLVEVGRRLWIACGLLKTANAALPVVALQVWTTLVGFMLVYGLWGIAGFYLIDKYVTKVWNRFRKMPDRLRLQAIRTARMEPKMNFRFYKC